MIESQENVQVLSLGVVNHAVGERPVPILWLHSCILFDVTPAEILFDPTKTSFSHQPHVPLDDDVGAPPKEGMHTVFRRV
jgi:hypothetical protein